MYFFIEKRILTNNFNMNISDRDFSTGGVLKEETPGAEQDKGTVGGNQKLHKGNS